MLTILAVIVHNRWQRSIIFTKWCRVESSTSENIRNFWFDGFIDSPWFVIAILAFNVEALLMVLQILESEFDFCFVNDFLETQDIFKFFSFSEPTRHTDSHYIERNSDE